MVGYNPRVLLTFFADNTTVFRYRVNPACVEKYNELKLGKKLRYVIFKISDDSKEIVPDDEGSEEDFEVFRQKITTMSEKNAAGKIRPSYAVYDLHYDTEDGPRTKILFISYTDDNNSGVKSRMLYAGSRQILKNALQGLAVDIQASDSDDLEYENLKKSASKGTAR